MKAQVELRSYLGENVRGEGSTLGKATLDAQIAMAVQPGDHVVLPGIQGCWVVHYRHVNFLAEGLHMSDVGIFMTLDVTPR